MRKLIIFSILIFACSCSSQNIQRLTFEKLKIETLNFLVKKSELKKERYEKFKSGEYNAYVLKGVINNLKEDKVLDGMYVFYLIDEYSKKYFVLVKENNYVILDVSTRFYLDESIKITLDYCEKNKYCVNLINEYIPILVKAFYSTNKNPMNGHDVNCENGVNDLKTLP
jgi:DNA polymerase III delta prime subunit